MNDEHPSVSKPIIHDAHAASVHTIDVPPLEEPAPTRGGTSGDLNLIPFLHSFRRRWLSGTAVGLFVGAILGAATWLLLPPKYTASALLRANSKERQLVFETADQTTQSDFEVYKATQEELVKSRFVLAAALRDGEINEYSLIRSEPDPVGWLKKELRVRFPDDAEILDIRLTGESPKEVAGIVNAVVDAYLHEVVDVEHARRKERLNELTTVYAEQEKVIREKRNALADLADQLGTWNPEALSLKQQLAIRQFGEYRGQLSRLEFDLMQKNIQLGAVRGLLKEKDRLLSDLKTRVLLEADPIGRELFTALQTIKQFEAEESRKVRADAPSSIRQYATRFHTQREIIEEQLNQRKRTLTEMAWAEKEAEAKELQAYVAMLEKQVADLKTVVDEKRTEADELGGSSVEIEMMRAETRHLEEVLDSIGNERERLKVELRSRPRVTLLQAAEKPEAYDRNFRIAASIFGALAGVLLPLALVTLWDVKDQKIGSGCELSNRALLDVIGTIPLLPADVIHPPEGAANSRNEAYRRLLNDCVDAATVVLLRKLQALDVRGLLVTSAVEAEGRTTLAVQLGMSLARAGHRTVLVDLDFTRPTLSALFGHAAESGARGVLSGTAELEDVLHETSLPLLSVLPASRQTSDDLVFHANGQMKRMLAGLRERFDYIIVDGGPLLPGADARYISQNVGAVVLSIMRDVSRADKVRAACDLLDTLGTPIVGAVVTASLGEVRSQGHRLRRPLAKPTTPQ